ncbi:Carboxylesterase [Planctomycetes bacterium CA13]|uniref:Carboxylesterase n=1 Tax=Novipirellula herctigrandis TaxID=2527986 RepID=A0A5C5Z189_9BACT|nr:Carboxylesterase [Planctomycetes bacterium CA13]
MSLRISRWATQCPIMSVILLISLLLCDLSRADEPDRALRTPIAEEHAAEEHAAEDTPKPKQTTLNWDRANVGLAPVYNDATYKVTVTLGVPYGQGMTYHPSDNTRCFPRNLTLDVYQPDDNHQQNRPVVVLIHGGGCWTGDSLMHSMVNGAQYFAQRGWVCYSINYRLHGDRGIAPKGWPDNRPTYSATRDAKAAIRWIRANAQKYRIDPDYIVAYGGSAGAYISVALGASDEEDFRDELLDNPNEKKLLENTHRDHSSSVQAVVSHWGSGLLLDLLRRFDGRNRFDANDAPLMIIHGTDDERVPFSEAIELQQKYRAELEVCTLDGWGHSAWGAKHEGTPIIDKVHAFLTRTLEMKPSDGTGIQSSSH